ncbi:MAG: alpha/beta hydrolase fold domain-containing protein [Leptolyngbyaceae cyanobacterium MO_188.B28]|nr:alpha/beta hydrolase fold domain-containing protein [Leptolyngbyaceae cyanobacterium MO_188.B28]
MFGWKAYLGCDPGGEAVSPYAAALGATDLTGLTLTYIGVGEMDLFLDESIYYAQRFLRAGVPTELHGDPGAFRCFDIYASTTTVSQRFITECNHIVKRVLHH